MNKRGKKIQLYFFTVVFLAVLLLTLYIFLPFLISLSVAAVLAVMFHPLYERILKLTKGKENISALLTVIITVIVVLLPLTFVGTIVFQEAKEFSVRVSNGGMDHVAHATNYIEQKVSRFIPDFSLNLNEYVRQGINWLIKNYGVIFSGIVKVLFALFLGLFAFFYFLKDGKELIRFVISLSPLEREDTREILNKLKIAVNSVIKGSLVVGAFQGLLIGIGVAVFGVPNPALLGSVAAVSALIPGIGTGLVTVPAVIYLFLTGSTASGVGLLIWGIIVGLSDNILKPKLMKKGMHIHPFLILLSVIGGLGFFGPVGFLLGPLVLSLLFALIEIYRFRMR